MEPPKVERSKSAISHAAPLHADKGVVPAADVGFNAVAWRVEVRPQHMPEKQRKRNVAWLGVGFLVLFTAFNVAYSQMTSFYPDQGFYAITISNALFGIGSLVAPSIAKPLGVVQTIALGSITYVLVVLSLNLNDGWLAVAINGLNGFGGGMLWIPQGYYVTMMAKNEFGDTDQVGYLSGLFFALFNANGIIGNGITLLALLVVSIRTVVWILVGVGFCGFVIISLTPDFDGRRALCKFGKSRRPTVLLKEGEQGNTLRDRVRELWDTARQKRMMLLLVSMLHAGWTTSVSFGVLATLTPGNIDDVAWVFLAYSCAGASSSFVWGKLYDRFGPAYPNYGHGLVAVLGYLVAVIIAANDYPWRYVIIAGALHGLTDAGGSAIANMSISTMFGPKSPPAFALYRLVFGIGASLCGFAAANLSYKVIYGIAVALLILAKATYFIMTQNGMVSPENTADNKVTPLVTVKSKDADDSSDDDDDNDSNDSGLGGVSTKKSTSNNSNIDSNGSNGSSGSSNKNLTTTTKNAGNPGRNHRYDKNSSSSSTTNSDDGVGGDTDIDTKPLTTPKKAQPTSNNNNNSKKSKKTFQLLPNSPARVADHDV